MIMLVAGNVSPGRAVGPRRIQLPPPLNHQKENLPLLNKFSNVLLKTLPNQAFLLDIDEIIHSWPKKQPKMFCTIA